MARSGFRVFIKPQSLANLRRDLKNYSQKKQQEVRTLVATTALQVQGGARRAVPVDTGRLRSSIAVEFSNDALHADIGTDVEYGPFVEFGTGDRVQVPAGQEEFAAQYKGQGIRKVNRTPRPFLFPAWERGRAAFMAGLKKILSKA